MVNRLKHPDEAYKFSAVVSRTSATPAGVVNRMNSLLGKLIQSPRDDYRGEVTVFDIKTLQVVQTSPDEWYGVAVVDIGIEKEKLDVEATFFATAAAERPAEVL